MSLGANRDYKTSDRRARRNLEAHGKRMAELIALGMEPVAASKQAFNDVLYPVKRFAEQAASAAAHGLREKDFLADCAPENRPAARKAFRAAKKELGSK
jgi:hypothetical protein